MDGHYWSCFPPCSYEGREIRFANTNLPSEAMHREFAMVYPTADGLGADFQTRRLSFLFISSGPPMGSLTLLSASFLLR